jgi:hypothetical protein
MNMPKYPTLRNHQELLANQGFLHRVLESSEPRIAILQQGQSQWTGVCQLNKYSKHPKVVVRLYLNKKYITIAQPSINNYLDACRLYDLAALFFIKYRIRGTDNIKFNYSREQAEYDLQHEVVHVDFLRAFEAGLLELGALPNEEQLEKLKFVQPKVRSLRAQQTDLREMLNAFREQVDVDSAALAATLRDIRAAVELTAKAQVVILERVNALGGKISKELVVSEPAK